MSKFPYTNKKIIITILICLLGIFIISLITITQLYRLAVSKTSDDLALINSSNVAKNDIAKEIKELLVLVIEKENTIIELLKQSMAEDSKNTQQQLAMNTAFLTWAEAQGLIIKE